MPARRMREICTSRAQEWHSRRERGERVAIAPEGPHARLGLVLPNGLGKRARELAASALGVFKGMLITCR
jgi:hypothetical protein